MNQTISVLNQKGGVGKSMVAQNLAACAHVRGRRTLLRDGDVQQTSWQWYSERSATSRLAGLRVDRVEDVKLWHLARHREEAANYDTIICDGPPSLGTISKAAAIVADVVVLPLRPANADVWALARTKLLLDEADEVRAQLGLGPVRRLVVLNEVRPRVRETAAVRDALSALGMEVFEGQLAHRAAYDRARGVGEGVVTFGDDLAARAEVEALYAAVTGGVS